MSDSWKYFLYVLRHKRAVYREGRKLGLGWWQCVIHDWTKLTPAEFPHYRRYFTQGDRSTEAVNAFQRAWLHHIHHNPHHWEHWILQQADGKVKVLRMPERYVKEMIADWRGVAVALGKKPDDALPWYREHAGEMAMHPQTRSRVEVLIGVVIPPGAMALVDSPTERIIGT